MMQARENEIKRKMELGVKGKQSIQINDLQVFLTNRCNLHCEMCGARFPEYENKTYDNEKPFDMTLSEYKKLVDRTVPFGLKFLNKFKKKYDDPQTILFSSAESMLNKDFYNIVIYTKKVYPNSNVRVISNGTIPLKNGQEDLVDNLYQIAFSVDGCTKETFEKIRTPAKYELVINNIKEYVEAKKKRNSKMRIVLAVTLSTRNAAELPGIVELANDIGGIESLWVQPMLVFDNKTKHLEQYLFSRMDKEQLGKYVNEAQKLSDKYNIQLDIMESIKEYAAKPDNNQADEEHLENESFDTQIKDDFQNKTSYCHMLCNGNVYVNQDASFRIVCCYLSSEGNSKLINEYKLNESTGSIVQRYNSEKYWQLRNDFWDGKWKNLCGDCAVGHSSYIEFKNGKDIFDFNI